ncbi:hypothetical protein [Halopiger goleimassiliensis]|uniref:hypothetical protein n=1 Tax=Halopiger goleimassiliensis TaxID=1293048 RepID=UPI0006782854|nr:hypothetical protein [Halopiger goleimassiliensis]
MKWRCTWCGKPHAENDPPCDNCGHNTFEKAVVRADEAATDDGTVDTGTTYVWRCQHCGRDHVKFTPPCSRCGNHDLEKIEQTYDDVERDLDTPSWFEVAKPYLPVIAVVGLVVALFATGIVPPSILPGVGAPSPPDASGNPVEAAGLDLEATETVIHDRLETKRESESRSYDDDLAAYAEYRNRALVAAEFDGERVEGASPDEFGVDCSGSVTAQSVVFPGVDLEAIDDEAALADAVATGLATNVEAATTGRYALEGVDLHETPDETLAATYATC